MTHVVKCFFVVVILKKSNGCICWSILTANPGEPELGDRRGKVSSSACSATESLDSSGTGFFTDGMPFPSP